MLDKPTIPDDQIITHLSHHYALSIRSLEFLPLGYDSYASVYRVGVSSPHITSDQAYFLKLKHAQFDPNCATVPHALQAAGISEVVAPIPTRSASLWTTLDTHTVLLYPFIDGTNGMTVELTPAQWIAFGRILKRIHSVTLPPEVAQHVPREDFAASPRHQHMIRDLHDLITSRDHPHAIQHEAAAVWQANAAEIALTVDRAVALGALMRDGDPHSVLCHADIHTGNLLIDPTGGLHVVDWDQPLFAPIERDLMFIAGLDLQRMSIGPHAAAPFFEGYGQPPINPLALVYYRYERVMEDIAEFAHTIFLQPDVSAETQSDALHYLRVQFAPDDMLAAAHHLYTHLFP